jgi:hypothetical protein
VLQGGHADCAFVEHSIECRFQSLPADVAYWPIVTGDILTARRRFRGIADMDRFSSRNDL